MPAGEDVDAYRRKSRRPILDPRPPRYLRMDCTEQSAAVTYAISYIMVFLWSNSRSAAELSLIRSKYFLGMLGTIWMKTEMAAISGVAIRLNGTVSCVCLTGHLGRGLMTTAGRDAAV